MIDVVSALMNEFSKSRTLMSLLIENCLSKFKKIHLRISSTPPDSVISLLYQKLLHLLQYSIISAADTAVSPKIWNTYQDMLEVVFFADLPPSMVLAFLAIFI